jgi:hypothetical protein
VFIFDDDSGSAARGHARAAKPQWLAQCVRRWQKKSNARSWFSGSVKSAPHGGIPALPTFRTSGFKNGSFPNRFEPRCARAALGGPALPGTTPLVTALCAVAGLRGSVDSALPREPFSPGRLLQQAAGVFDR